MATIEKIAYHLGQRDEAPNHALAAALAKEENAAQKRLTKVIKQLSQA